MLDYFVKDLATLLQNDKQNVILSIESFFK